jgi:hypothetical protein
MSWARTGLLWWVRDRRSGLTAYVPNPHTKAKRLRADANKKLTGRGRSVRDQSSIALNMLAVLSKRVRQFAVQKEGSTSLSAVGAQ